MECLTVMRGGDLITDREGEGYLWGASIGELQCVLETYCATLNDTVVQYSMRHCGAECCDAMCCV